MENRTKAVFIAAPLLILAVASIAFWTMPAPATVNLSGLNTLSTNPGLSLNVSSWSKAAAVDENLTAVIQLSPKWPLELKSLTITTPGFSILSVNSSLPLQLDQNATIAITFRSNQSYSGSILLLASSLNASGLAEKILVPDVTANTSSKTVTLIAVFNAGDIPLTNSTAYLVRSDRLVVNSTPLHTEGLLPGKISYFYTDMSYAGATVIEVYRVNVVTITGANATSRVFALDCNC